MTTMNMIQALNSAMDVMMERDNNVVIFGEDVGYFGGVFSATAGLQKKYGKTRVFDTPIAKGGILGPAIGMGAYGLRQVEIGGAAWRGRVVPSGLVVEWGGQIKKED